MAPRKIRTITVIPPTINPRTGQSQTSTRKRRVAAYARVSTDNEEQQTSYEAQVDYDCAMTSLSRASVATLR